MAPCSQWPAEFSHPNYRRVPLRAIGFLAEDRAFAFRATFARCDLFFMTCLTVMRLREAGLTFALTGLRFAVRVLIGVARSAGVALGGCSIQP